MTVVDRLSRVLERRLSRRSFVVRSAFAGSALAAGQAGFLVKPESAYGALCDSVYCGSPDCSCGSTCCAGYTEFCCVLDGGFNSCPSGTVMGGWWKADGSSYCSGPRYYMDCNAVCRCGSGCGNGYGFCDPGCDGLRCECAGGNCGNYLTGCFQFRYGQCNQHVACIGRIHCRVVTCVPPWEIDDCTTTSMVDDGTAEQNAACLRPGPTYPPPPKPTCPSPATECKAVGMVLTPGDRGYGVGTSFGTVIGLGDEPSTSIAHEISTPVTDLDKCRGPRGYWILTAPGRVLPINGAPFYGEPLNDYPDPCVAVCSSATGKGYWVMTSGGRIRHFGDAGYHGEPLGMRIPTPWVSLAATPSGGGYWTVAGGGRVRAFGDAAYDGDTVDLHLEEPIVKVVASPTGGYWVVTSNGRIFEYGGATFHGSPFRARDLPAPIVDMVATTTGAGYHCLDRFGQVYSYGDAVNHGNA